MVKPLEKNRIESLRQWADGVVAGEVSTTSISAAQVAIELLDHIKFLQDMYASEHHMRKEISKHNQEIGRGLVALADELGMPHSELQSAEKILERFKVVLKEYRRGKSILEAGMNVDHE